MALQAKIKDKTVSVGDLVKVSVRLIESGKSRLAHFEGLVIAIKGKGEGKSFTVRRIGTGAVGIERLWPLNSPWIEKVQVKKKGKVRRAKLYYLRQRKGKAALKVKTRKTQKKASSKKVNQKAKPQQKASSN